MTAVLASGDAIAAIATPAGRGGIGVVRVSGRNLAGWAKALTGIEPEPRRAPLARLADGAGRAIDEGLVLWFAAPHSYTGEDVLELQGHGGPVVMRMLLARCVELGARIAEPGEFTRRAFLNDRLDLAQAEGVADLIDAASEAAARSALRSLSGEFSRRVHEIADELIALRTLVEATLDFPEEDIDPLDRADARARLKKLREMTERLAGDARQGAVLRSGITVVIAGAPNVGKSSLLNRLAGEDVAIVTPIAGTTRDTVRETLTIEGVPLHVIDTAGVREASDEVERLGIERTWAAIAKADVGLLMVDAREALTEGDGAILEALPRRAERLVVRNKVDLCAGDLTPIEGVPEGAQVVAVSAKTGEGVDMLKAALLKVAGWQGGSDDVLLARERHLAEIGRALACLAAANDQQGMTELMAEELRLAQQALNGITGEFGSDDLLGEIFGRFCIGK